MDEDNSNQVSESRARQLRQSSSIRSQRNVFFRLNFATNEIVQTQRGNMTQIIIDINRRLTYDSYKILYLVYDYCEPYLDFKISNINYLKELDTGEPKNFISRIYKSVWNTRNNFFGFAYDREHEKRVKYHWLLKLAYLTWFTNMFMCILIPIIMRHDKWLEGILWLGHYIFGSYLVISYISEIVLFLWLTDALRQPLPDNMSKMSRCGYKLMRLYFILVTAFQSLISKAAEYTAISFMVEIIKCYGLESKEEVQILLLVLFIISIFTFVLTILFPVIVFISLIFKPPEDTFYPLTAHTARLLMCADLKLLSRYVERYAINYYGPLLWWNQPTFITLSWVKLLVEDMVELIIQLLFILYIEKDNKGFVMTTTVSLTGSSIISSFMTIYFKQTSELDHENLNRVKEFI